MSTQQPGPSLPQVVNVVLAVVLGLSIVGFIIGIRPATSDAGLMLRPVPVSRGVVQSQPYKKLGQRARKQTTVTSDLARLRAGIPAATAKVPPQTDEQRKAALAARAARRAFDGAPPVVPHPVDNQGPVACLSCHRHGMRLAGRSAPAMSHKELASCTQCHVPGTAGPAPAVGSATSFVGLASPGKGDRAWQGAPPLIPHATHMREKCASCHGVNGRPGLRTSHPERVSCMQCHVPR